jgi:hypothetical protein
MTKLPQKKTGSIILLAYVAIAVFFAHVYICTHIGHEHDYAGPEGNCAVCHGIKLAQLLLEGLERIGLAATGAVFFISLKQFFKKQAKDDWIVMTLVALKIRLNF